MPSAASTPRRRPRRRSLTFAAVGTATLATSLLTALPTHADPCSGLNCWLEDGGGSTPGGGGGGGGGTGEIPTLPGDEGGVVPGVGNGPPAAPAPATGDLAEQARASAQLPPLRVHTSPEGKTYVQMRTSLWVEGFVPVATAPINVGGQTVQATATPKSVTWNLGETTLTCDEAGSSNSTACGYVYRRSSAGAPGGAYEITATITWDVNWTCTGAECDAPGGTLAPLTATSPPESLIVSEIQANSRQ